MTDDAWNELVLLELKYGEEKLHEMVRDWFKYLEECNE